MTIQGTPEGLGAIEWPDGARCAVVLTVNFDAELFWLRMDESVVRRPKTQSIGEYGANRGSWRVLDALLEAQVPSSWLIPGSIAERYAAVVRAARDEGHEIALRGEDDLTTLDRAEQLDALTLGIDRVEAVVGTRPCGFRPAGDYTPATAGVLCELGFSWSSALRGDDRPVFLEDERGEGSIVDLPQLWELQDAPYFLFNYEPAYPPGACRPASFARVAQDWKQEFDAYHAEGLCFVLCVDPQAIGSPGRISVLRELLAHIRMHDDVWTATGAEVAEWWRQAGIPNSGGGSEAVRRRALAEREAAA